MKITIIRHPQTLHNKSNKLTGWEESKYSDPGKLQFKNILKYLSKNKEKIYSSDLKRCSDIAKRMKSPKREIEITKEIRERNFRETEPKKNYETKKDFESRINTFVKKLKTDSILITHEGVLVYILKKFCKYQFTAADLPRNIIFEIEINENSKKLRKITL